MQAPFTHFIRNHDGPGSLWLLSPKRLAESGRAAEAEVLPSEAYTYYSKRDKRWQVSSTYPESVARPASIRRYVNGVEVE